jgi:hypothetical protein
MASLLAGLRIALPMRRTTGSPLPQLASRNETDLAKPLATTKVACARRNRTPPSLRKSAGITP